MVIYYSALPRVQIGDYLIQDLGECHLFYFFVFRDRVSLHGPGCPETHFADWLVLTSEMCLLLASPWWDQQCHQLAPCKYIFLGRVCGEDCERARQVKHLLHKPDDLSLIPRTHER